MKRPGVPVVALWVTAQLWATVGYADFNPQGRNRKKAQAPASQPQRRTPQTSEPKQAAKPAPTNPPSSPAAKPAAVEPTQTATERSGAALIQRYTAIVLAQPGSVFPLQRLAELYRERDGNIEQLLAEFRQRASAAGPEQYSALVTLAGLLQQSQRADEATATLRAALQLKPDDPRAQQALALAEESAGNKAAARSLLERTLPQINNDADKEQVIRHLIQLCLDLSDIAAAKRYHGDLVRRAHGSFFTRAELGREFAARGLFPQAEAEYRELVRDVAGDNRALGPALRDLGVALAAQGKNDEALSTFNRALGLVSESGLKQELLEKIAHLYRERNQLALFISELQRSSSGDPERLRMLSALFEETGRIDEALSTYRKVLDRRRDDVELHVRVIRLLQLQGQLDEAISAYRKLITIAPRNPDYVFQLSEALLQRGDRSAAIAELDRLETRSREDEQTLTALVDVFERIGERERSQRLLEQLARSGLSSEHLVELGARYYRDGDSDKAVKTWKRILSGTGNRAKALQALGEVYLEHDMTDQALEALKEAVELEPKSIPLRKALAVALERTGASAPTALRVQRYEQARKVWEQLLTDGHRDSALESEARQHIVTLWSLVGTLQDRVRPLERNLKTNPPSLASGRLLAEVYVRLRRHDQAERVLRLIVSAAPGDTTSFLRLERVLILQHKLGDAIDVLKRLVALDPKRARDYYQRMAQYAAELYRDDDAIQYATQAVALTPDDASGHEKLGQMYQKRQSFDLAIAEYRKAIAQNERLFSAYFSLAELLLSRGQVSEADQLLRRVVRSATDDELIARATRLCLQLHLGDGTVEQLERELLPSALGNPQKPIYRRLLVEIYSALAFPLVQKAQSADISVREHAEGELRKIGQRAVKPLLDTLGDAQASEQRVAIELLTQLHNESAAPALYTFATSDADPELRQRAMIAAGAAPDATLLGKLRTLLFDEGRPTVDEADPVSIAATWALCRLPQPEARKLVRSLLGADSASARAMAALSVAMHRGAMTEAQLLPLLGREQGSLTRSAAAFALGELNAKSRVSALIPLRESADPRLRRVALLSLARLNDTSSRAAVADGMLESDPNARQLMIGAAVVLTTGRYAPLRSPFAIPVGRVSVGDMLSNLAPANSSASERAEAFLHFNKELTEKLRTRLQGSSDAIPATVDLLLNEADESEFEPLVPSSAARDPVNLLAPELAQRVRDAVEQLAQSLLPEFVRLAQHGSAVVRGAAVRFLSTRHEAEALECVIQGLNDDDKSVVQSTLEAIARHPSSRLLAALLPLLSAETEWPLRIAALQTLSHFNQQTIAVTEQPEWAHAESVIAQVALEDEFALTREAAAKTLFALSKQAAAPVLRRMIENDAEPRVRDTASHLLAPLKPSATRGQ